ncbi:hypothetical protein GBA52_024655 [Prunus armeniaca]|nr:hypothetical protein GBA52_024655 [Prunus armeniaca]
MKPIQMRSSKLQQQRKRYILKLRQKPKPNESSDESALPSLTWYYRGVGSLDNWACKLKLGDLKGALLDTDFAMRDAEDNVKALFRQDSPFVQLDFERHPSDNCLLIGTIVRFSSAKIRECFSSPSLILLLYYFSVFSRLPHHPYTTVPLNAL